MLSKCQNEFIFTASHLQALRYRFSPRSIPRRKNKNCDKCNKILKKKREARRFSYYLIMTKMKNKNPSADTETSGAFNALAVTVI